MAGNSSLVIDLVEDDSEEKDSDSEEETKADTAQQSGGFPAQ